MTLADYFKEMQATSNEAEAQYLALTEEADPMLTALSFSPADGWDSDVAGAGEQLLSARTDDALFTQQAVDVDLIIFEGLRDMLTRILTRIEAIDGGIHTAELIQPWPDARGKDPVAVKRQEAYTPPN